MGNRHDVVASDLDTSNSGRNERRQGCGGESHGNECWHRSRARIYHSTECLLQHAGWSQHWLSVRRSLVGVMVPSHRGFRMPWPCRRRSARALEGGKNRSQPIALPPTRRALTRQCGIATRRKQRNCTRSTTWPTLIYSKRKTRKQKRSSISPAPCAKPIPSWNSARLTLWPLFH